MAGFLAAAGLIGGAASAAGHGLADSHKRAGDVGGADVIFQTASADNVFCLEHHCGFHFRRVTVMLWRLDTGDIAGALEIARYALKYGLTMPGKHRRTPPYMFTEEVALAAMRAHAAGESVDPRLLTETLELTATADMPDEVRAKLHKITGLFLRDGGDAAGALAHLQRATQLDCQAGVKKEIERLERELKPKPEPQPKAATRTPRKTRSVTPAKRGRPKKKAS